MPDFMHAIIAAVLSVGLAFVMRECDRMRRINRAARAAADRAELGATWEQLDTEWARLAAREVQASHRGALEVAYVSAVRRNADLQQRLEAVQESVDDLEDLIRQERAIHEETIRRAEKAERDARLAGTRADNWEAEARRAHQNAGYWQERAETAEGEVARLRAGEAEDYAPAAVPDTPGEWIRMWNEADADKRQSIAAQVLRLALHEQACALDGAGKVVPE